MGFRDMAGRVALRQAAIGPLTDAYNEVSRLYYLAERTGEDLGAEIDEANERVRYLQHVRRTGRVPD